jgi:hypothetical protein
MANSQVSNLVSVSPQQGGEKTRSPTTGISPESVIVAPENRPSVKQSVDAGHFQKAGPQQVNLPGEGRFIDIKPVPIPMR